MAESISSSDSGRVQAEGLRDSTRNSDGSEQFVSVVSHEMRSSLHAIVGLTELLLESPQLQSEERYHVDAIHQEAASLRRLVDDLLDMAKINAGKLSLTAEPFAPTKVVHSVASSMRAQASSKGLDFIVNLDPAVPRTLRGDSHRLRQILMNLVSNAVKYTDCGWVKVEMDLVSSTHELDVVRFAVIDTGPGFPTEAIEHLFEPFHQVRETDGLKGTGLGLGITRQLAALMGSEVDLKTGPDGSTFSCVIGFHKARRRDDLFKAGLSPLSDEAVLPKRSLIVDDTEINRKLFKSQLKRLGVDSLAVASGLEAIEALQKEEFDVILMDWHMPGMDGLETTRRIRALGKEGSTIPIIAVTASNLTGDREICLAAGLDDFLPKPVGIEELSEVLSRWASQRVDSRDSGEDESSDVTSDSEDTIEGDVGEIHSMVEAGLDKIVSEVGDPSLALVLVETFLSELPVWLGDLTPENLERDRRGAKRAAHTMKSSLRLFNLDAVAGWCEELETALGSDDFDREVVQKLSLKVDHCSNKVANELNTIKSKLIESST